MCRDKIEVVFSTVFYSVLEAYVMRPWSDIARLWGGGKSTLKERVEGKAPAAQASGVLG